MKKILGTTLFLLVILSSFTAGLILIENPQPALVILGNPYPQHFSIPEGEEYTAYFYIVDDFGVEEMKLYYRVNKGEWKPRLIHIAPINENEEIYNSIASRIQNKSAGLWGFYGKATIPEQKAGNIVEFKVVVKDKEGHSSESITGKYLVINPSKKRVLIVDPSVKERTFLEGLSNIELLINTTEVYPIDLNDYKEELEKVQPFRLYPQFLKEHHWEYLAKYYNLAIISPKELSNTLKEFRPEVIILSNLWLKRWEVPDIQGLINYLRQNNAGLIVTHGTLFDGVVYEGDKPTQIGTLSHIGSFDAYEKDSLATLLGLELLPVAEEIREEMARKGKYAVAEIPAIVPFVPSKGTLLIKNTNTIKTTPTIEFPNGTNTAFGWQYLLPSESLNFAREKIRETKSREKEKILDFFILQREIFGHSNPSQGIFALDFPLLNGLISLKITDDEIMGQIGPTIVTLTPDQQIVERVRLINAINKDIARLDAFSSDYLSAVITRDEKHRGDGIRSVYVSFEIEAGGEQELLALKDIVEWASNFEPIRTFAPIVQIKILSNDIDWNIQGNYLKKHLEKMGVAVTRITPQDFETYKKSKIIVILGGPKAYYGVGKYVKQVLNEYEQKSIINGEQGIFIKRDVWDEGQIVIVLAGKERYQTGAKVLKYSEGVNDKYVNLLAEFLTN